MLFSLISFILTISVLPCLNLLQIEPLPILQPTPYFLPAYDILCFETKHKGAIQVYGSSGVRRQADGHVRLSVFAEGLLALTVEGTGERVPTLLLTTEQAEKLQHALEDLIPQADSNVQSASPVDPWDGTERRTIRR